MTVTSVSNNLYVVANFKVFFCSSLNSLLCLTLCLLHCIVILYLVQDFIPQCFLKILNWQWSWFQGQSIMSVGSKTTIVKWMFTFYILCCLHLVEVLNHQETIESSSSRTLIMIEEICPFTEQLRRSNCHLSQVGYEKIEYQTPILMTEHFISSSCSLNSYEISN